ncbi:MAG: ABC transporter substrate-binding protein [Gammaproteobacteria bacterium]|nr:ABC transporter substrate-binding protein [Gammaproteobacteria bacterium]
MLKRLLITLFLGIFCSIALAVTSPVDMLQGTSNAMIGALKQNKTTIKTNPALVESLARQILLPHIDVSSMARLALGRDGWQKATPAQQQEFITQFTTLMIRTYSTALASYTNQVVQYNPIRGGYENQKQVQVDSKILQQGGPAIPVSYKLVLRGSQWMVYDFSVDGVSLVQSFRSQFTQTLNQGGMTALLASLQSHNASRSK